jgi:heme exporter protein CcmD
MSALGGFIDLPHIGYVIAAYAAAAIVVAFLIASIVSDHRALRRALGAYGTKAAGEAGLDIP